MNDNIPEKINSLLSEYNMLRDEMRLFLGFHRRDTQIILTIITISYGFITKASGDKILEKFVNELIFILPSVIFLYIVLQTINFHMVSVQGKSRARIEREINNLLGGEYMIFDNKISPIHIRSFTKSPIPLATIIYFTFFIWVFLFFSYKEFELNNFKLSFISYVNISEFLIIIILLFLSFKWERFFNKPENKKILISDILIKNK
jgi:hypothetical protein